MGEPGGRLLQRQQSQVPLLLAGPEEGSDEPAAVGEHVGPSDGRVALEILCLSEPSYFITTN